MALKCDQCGKGVVFTTIQRHKRGVAGGRWKKRAQKSRKIIKPNLQAYRGLLNGKQGKWKLCTRCLRTLKRGPRIKKEKKEKKTAPKK